MRSVHSWSWLVAVCVVGLGLAATAKSDTYNFYFSKPKKQAEEAAPPAKVAPPAPVEEDGLPPAPDHLPGEAPAEAEHPAPPAASAPVVVNGGAGQPIVINNNNNITIPAVRPSATPPSKERPASPSLLSPAESTLVTASVSESRSRWHFGLGLVHTPSATRLEGDGAETGGVVSLGYDFTHWLGFNLYSGGLVYDSGSPETHYYGGADLEVHPFHITIGRLDVLELGFLVGGSTARADWDNWGSLHLGGRATLSFDRQFGITVATRANLGTVVFEGGLVTRF